MANTSNDTFDPFEQVTPFFNRAQLFAFSQAPSEEALKRVNRGGSHDYLPQEYVRALLDRFIGPGRWALRSALVKTYEETIKKGDKENIAVTAVVNVELDILSATDPDQRLTYAGIGTHTMEAGLDKGIAAAVGNAITSAESKGLKAAAKNLGKAFGSDLKNKLDRNVLPPTIAAYAQIMAERRGVQALPAPEGDGQAQAAIADGDGSAEPDGSSAAAGGREERQPEASRDREQPQQRREQQQERQAPRSAERSREEPSRQTAAKGRGASEAAPADAQPAKPAAKAPSKQQAADTGAAAGADQKVDGDAAPAPAQGDEPPAWELSMRPSTFKDWVACIRTITMRLDSMRSVKEIETFARRHADLISSLPIIPAEGDKPEKNFQARWRTIVAKAYERLNEEVPEQYREPALASA